jgi:hypothetical protein
MVPIQPVRRPALPRRHLTLGHLKLGHLALSHLALGALALSVLPAVASAAPVQAPSASDAFHRAYYLEHEKGDLGAAMTLYREAVKSGSLSAAERAEVEEHLRACAEELAMADLAQLMPSDTIVYAELNDPGAQMASLMDQLGLLQGTDRAGNIALSPHLLRGVLGLKGAAVAVTRIDPTAGMPGGVLILHPGDMDAVRGLIETVLPAGGQSVEPIAGHATFLVEDMVHVTMGQRLIIASTERQLIADVLRRVDGDRSDSLASNPDLSAALEGHGDDLLYFCANAEPVLPLLEGALGALSGESSEAAMAIQLLDPESLRTISGGLAVNANGLAMDIGLSLEEGHRSLAFNLLRMPHVSESTFDLIPNGAAAFLASSLNERNDGGTGVTDAAGRPVVTVMDIGREVFGNLVDVAAFALPSMSEGPGGMPIPDAALAMSVNDPERSKAIWRLILGMAQGATDERGNMQARTSRVGDQEVERFEIEGVNVFLYTQGHRLVISPSMNAIEAAVAAAAGDNIHRDALFAGLAHQTSQDHTSVVGVSMGRIAQIARQVMPERELREVGPYLELLNDAALVATTRHSDTDLRWSAKMTGLPNVGPLVNQLVQAEMGNGASFRAQPATVRASSVSNPPKPASDGQQLAHAMNPHVDTSVSGGTQAAFQALLSEGHVEAAGALIPVIARDFASDPMSANDFVWNLISTESGEALASSLLPVIQSAAEATGQENWYILDTMAHVQFAAGDAQGAIKTSRHAIKVARDQSDPRANEAEAALARFVKAAKREMLR